MLASNRLLPPELVALDDQGDPATLPHDAFVFGEEVGGPIASTKTTDLHLLDLRREFACRLLESRAELPSWGTPASPPRRANGEPRWNRQREGEAAGRCRVADE